MTEITIIQEEAKTITACPDAARSAFLVDADELPAALGMGARPQRVVPG